MKAFYQLSYEEVAKNLNTSLRGLKKSDIPSLQNKYGKNVLKENKQKSRLTIFLSQFKDVMIMILIVAAGISFALGEHMDAYVILAIIMANAWIGYMQEYNAEESVRLLQKMSAQYAMVLRDNNHEKLDAAELLPGDVILLEAGDIVPADARLFQISALKTEEAALTGESHSIEKTVDVLPGDQLGPGDQLNMVFKGTVVSNGTAKAIVTAIGMATEIGKIAGLLEVGQQQSPLQKRLGLFSKQMAVAVILICIIVFGLGMYRGEPAFLMFLTALSLAVAALPEALPAVVTIALSKGASRMVKQKALMRKLPAVETLGSVTYICTDKTGTLTQNIMTVEKIRSIDEKEELLKYAMMLNNDVRFANDGQIMGDSTETALIRFAQDHQIAKDEADNRYPLVGKIPFDSIRMRMSSLHQHQNQWILFTKGAPVKITEVLAADEKEQSQAWLDINREYAADGLRVLFFGYKILDEKPTTIDEGLEEGISFLGLAAMIDPPREEVIDAIAECRQAGIHTVMITGDQPLTAHAIAGRLQMLADGVPEIMTGAELAKTSEPDFNQKVRHISVYARVSPEQKLTIVKTLQEKGEFVAMTGDGVNDAPSLKQADIGIAMGITGTDVSKDAADMILLDDNFATIVKAVKEGRRIYENIKKFILYVLSCNLAEILTLVAAPMLGLAIPLLPIHILWINLVTDGFPGLALTSEPAEKGIMSRPPRPPGESLFAGGLIPKVVFTGLWMALIVLIVQYFIAEKGYDVQTQQTTVFTLLCFIQLGNAMAVRQTYNAMFNTKLASNKGLVIIIVLTVLLQLLLVYVPLLQPIFKTVSIDLTIIAIIIATTLIGVLGIELIKSMINKYYIRRKKGISANHIK